MCMKLISGCYQQMVLCYIPRRNIYSEELLKTLYIDSNLAFIKVMLRYVPEHTTGEVFVVHFNPPTPHPPTGGQGLNMTNGA